ncbi:hypothetical protein IAQ61_005246 [Plenodomus lingam]|uniref:uncharacterized protein n=1 Tax=Leptosphaeria maculans TaxID=5022 RepID=UPI00332448AD|nr:hypothetical protein IAQ61_005246 [Plenodomus lingam]
MERQYDEYDRHVDSRHFEALSRLLENDSSNVRSCPLVHAALQRVSNAVFLFQPTPRVISVWTHRDRVITTSHDTVLPTRQRASKIAKENIDLTSGAQCKLELVGRCWRAAKGRRVKDGRAVVSQNKLWNRNRNLPCHILSWPVSPQPDPSILDAETEQQQNRLAG